MSDPTMTIVAASIGGALVGVAAALVTAKVFFGRKLNEVTARLEKSDKSRSQTNGMLLQARKQLEQLQKDIEEARRAQRSATRAAPTPATAAEIAEKKAAEVAAARARLDLALDDGASIFGGFVHTTTARGFADTQPMSTLGPQAATPAPARAA